MGQGYAVLLKYTKDETGAVRATCQAGASPYIRIAQILLRIVHQIHPDVGNSLAIDQFRLGHRSVELLGYIHIIGGYVSLLVIQHDLNPSVQLLHDFQLFAFRHLCDYRVVRSRALPHKQSAGIAHRHIGCNLVRPVPGFLTC